MSVHHEVERTYQPESDALLPDFTRLARVSAVGEPVTFTLEATYFDTPGLALARAGVTLRRRTGGPDAGWHLKVPAGAGRDEVHVPLSRALHVPPKPLRTAVHPWTLGVELVPVASVTTTRTTYTLLGRDDVVLAEAADDVVDAEVLLEARAPLSWREWEVELVEGTPGLLAEVDALMAAGGVPVSDLPRKLARALGDLLEQPDDDLSPRPGQPATRVLSARLVAQVEELKLRDSQIRRGAGPGVHRTRVALRRIRAELGTFRPMFDASVTEELREELRWAARTLGESRDLDVLADVLTDTLASEPADLVVGPVEQGLADGLAERARAARAVTREAMDSERYRRLIEALNAVVERTPWSENAELPTGQVLPGRVKRDVKRLRRQVRSAAEQPAGTPDHADALHQVRKAAKRLRYAAETLEPAYGRQARRLAKRAKSIQSVLGEHHDAVVARVVLREIATTADAAGESTFTHGRLDARLEQRATELEGEFAKAWRKASRRKYRSWL